MRVTYIPHGNDNSPNKITYGENIKTNRKYAYKNGCISLKLLLCIFVILCGLFVFTSRSQAVITSISTAEEFRSFMGDVSNYSGVTVTLNNDIDLNDEDITSYYKQKNGFGGIFDGKGHTISGIKINTVLTHVTGSTGSAHEFGGLFRELGSSGVIRDLTLEGSIRVNVSEMGNTISVGGFVGECSGTIERCQSNLDIKVINNPILRRG